MGNIMYNRIYSDKSEKDRPVHNDNHRTIKISQQTGTGIWPCHLPDSRISKLEEHDENEKKHSK